MIMAGQSTLKVLRNRSVSPLMQRVAARPALPLTEGVRMRWRPDFVCWRAGKVVIVEIAGMLNNPEYANNLRAKSKVWRSLALQGNFGYEIYAAATNGELGFRAIMKV
jgi:hypothetical protein